MTTKEIGEKCIKIGLGLVCYENSGRKKLKKLLFDLENEKNHEHKKEIESDVSDHTLKMGERGKVWLKNLDENKATFAKNKKDFWKEYKNFKDQMSGLRKAANKLMGTLDNVLESSDPYPEWAGIDKSYYHKKLMDCIDESIQQAWWFKAILI